MKFLCGLGFILRLAVVCLVAGLAVGCWLGAGAADRAAGTEVPPATTATLHPG